VSELEDCCSSVFVNYRCERLIAEARGQLRNPEEVVCLLLEAMTRKLVKTQQAEKT
jgi:hypothetical protein